jgi:D-alanyl-D-alanine carboxypeptidase/D-alanyl-D-alanine-endopeptidase (penicillin-binding protein 4)
MIAKLQHPFGILGIALGILLSACSTPRAAHGPDGKTLRFLKNSEVFQGSLTGFILVDAESGKVLAAQQADNYFTPASNTKILTLVTALAFIPDSIPSLQQAEWKGKTIWRGCADPSFLHPKFEAWQTTFRGLKSQPEQAFGMARPLSSARLGPGWAWDDANDYYSAERSDWPLYGGVMQIIQANGTARVEPPFFQSRLIDPDEPGLPASWATDPCAPYYTYQKTLQETPDTSLQSIRFMDAFKSELLADTMKHPFPMFAPEQGPQWRTVYACPGDTVFRRMMHQSDNFIAEHVLLAASGTLGDTLSAEKIIRIALDSLFPSDAHPPRWVDGSGLSRYNLITPAYLSKALRMLWIKEDQDRLFSLFPAGGRNGTLKNWYGGESPYVFAKSGSMGGVYCLSGYLVARSGRVLIFSVMHNQFTGSNKPWKEETQALLESIRDRY